MDAAEIAPPKPRQRPGSACQECRRRKLRCDGQQPQCEACFQSGAQCVPVATHAQRGPKRGHVKALENRLGIRSDSQSKYPTSRLTREITATLEQRLLEQQQQQQQQQQQSLLAPQIDDIDLLDGATLDTYFDMDGSDSPNSLLMAPNFKDQVVPQTLASPTNFPVSDLLRSEL